MSRFWRMSRRLWAIRKAWCELTGGHDLVLNGAFMRRDTDLASKVCTECLRCGKRTAWEDVPKRSPSRNQDGET